MIASPYITQLSERLKSAPKPIVFPEGSDPRILQAARAIAREGIALPILLGDRAFIKRSAHALDIKLEGIRIVEPEGSDRLNFFFQKMRQKERLQRFSDKQLSTLLLDSNYFGAMMLDGGEAAALISGATLATSSALVPLFRTIPLEDGIQTASSMLLLEMEENEHIGMHGLLFLADCSVIPNPTAQQLSDIALSTAKLAFLLRGEMPRVAFVSYSSHCAQTNDPSVQKIQQAFALTKERLTSLDFPIEIDGDLQVDAALDLFVAEQKNITGPVAGRANVLIFPDLHSGNIAAKMAQVVANIRAYGPILTGLQKPAAEISRGSSAHDIFGTAVILCTLAKPSEAL
ncbi:MAG: hypothetical protein A2Y14_05765 [Verrucomicrobia bacterium GWF2_51_19]|nr:MAG: hypothetical protein A2Y14_05765 [Verrucomicrobia bacterium GWF2_51_19]HCJ12157.1 phosphate acetyltransferase [Opitutae bacterium]